jgi:hypothetical protein
MALRRSHAVGSRTKSSSPFWFGSCIYCGRNRVWSLVVIPKNLKIVSSQSRGTRWPYQALCELPNAVRCIGSAQKTRFVANQSSWEKNGVIMQHVTFLAFNRSAKTGQIVFSLMQYPSAKTKKRKKNYARLQISHPMYNCMHCMRRKTYPRIWSRALRQIWLDGCNGNLHGFLHWLFVFISSKKWWDYHQTVAP